MKLIGTSILDQFDKDVITDEDKLIMLSTICKLVVENMILHTKVMQAAQK